MEYGSATEGKDNTESNSKTQEDEMNMDQKRHLVAIQRIALKEIDQNVAHEGMSPGGSEKDR